MKAKSPDIKEIPELFQKSFPRTRSIHIILYQGSPNSLTYWVEFQKCMVSYQSQNLYDNEIHTRLNLRVQSYSKKNKILF